MPRRPLLTHGLGPAFLYLLGFVALTWPLATTFATHFWCDPGDGLANAWNVWWVGHATTSLSNPWWTDWLYHPDGVTLIAQTLNPFNGFLGIPLSLFLPLNQVYNTLVAFAFVATGLTTFWLAWHASRHYWRACSPGSHSRSPASTSCGRTGTSTSCRSSGCHCSS